MYTCIGYCTYTANRASKTPPPPPTLGAAHSQTAYVYAESAKEIWLIDRNVMNGCHILSSTHFNYWAHQDNALSWGQKFFGSHLKWNIHVLEQVPSHIPRYCWVWHIPPPQKKDKTPFWHVITGRSSYMGRHVRICQNKLTKHLKMQAFLL